MKKTILILATILLSANVFGQQKGELNFGGQVGFLSVSTKQKDSDGASQTQKIGGIFGIGANATYFVIDNLGVSLGMGFNTGKLYDNDIISIVSGDYGWANLFGFDASASYYVKIVGNFYWAPSFFVNDYFGGLHSKDGKKSKREDGINEFSLGLNLAGLEFRFNDHFSIFGTCGKLAFTSVCVDDLNGSKKFVNIWNMDLSNILSPRIGFRYWL